MWKTVLTPPLLGLAFALVAGGARAQAVQDPGTIARAAENFVRHELPATSRAAARIRAVRLDARLRLAPCATPLEAGWAAGAAPRARTSVQVECRSGIPWRVHVPVTIRSAIEVLVLAAPATRGQSLSGADVTRRQVEVDGLAHLYVRSADELAGRHLIRPAPAGVPLPVAWLAPDKIVQRGQAVTLVASADGIRIRAPGRALADGALAERVRVQNLSSLKVVEGVVENGSEVRVSP